MSHLSIYTTLVCLVVSTTLPISSGTNSTYNKFYSSAETKYLHQASLSSQETRNLNLLLAFVLDSPEFRPLTLSIILPEFQSSTADVLLRYSAESPILVYKIRARDLSLKATWMERSHLTWAFFVNDVFSLNIFIYWQPKMWQSSNQYLIFFNGRTTAVAWRDIFKNLWNKYSVYRAVILSMEDNFNCLLRYAPFEVHDNEFGGVHKLCLTMNVTVQKSFEDYGDGGSRHLAELKNVKVEFSKETKQSSPETYDYETSRYLTELNNVDEVLLNENFTDRKSLDYYDGSRHLVELKNVEVEFSKETKQSSPESYDDDTSRYFSELNNVNKVLLLNETTRLFEIFHDMNDYPVEVVVFESLLMGIAYDDKTRLRLSKVDAEVLYSLEGATRSKFRMKVMRTVEFRRIADPFDLSLRDIESGRAEMVITGFFVKSYPLHPNFRFTAAVYEDKLCFLAPDSGLVPKAYMPFLPFEKDLWALLAIYNVGITLLWCFVKYLNLAFQRRDVQPTMTRIENDSLGKGDVDGALKQLEGEGSYVSRTLSSRDKGDMLGPLKKLEFKTTSEASYPSRALSSRVKGDLLGPLKQLKGEASYSCQTLSSSDKGALPRPLKKLDVNSTSEASYPSRPLSPSNNRALPIPLKQLEVNSTSEASYPSRATNKLRNSSKNLKNPSATPSNPPTEPPQVPRYVSLFFDFVELFCYPLQTGDTPAQRALLTGTLFFGLIVNGVYQSCLVSSLSKPFHYPQLNTLEEVLDSGKTLFTKYANLKNVFQDDMPLDRAFLQRIRVVNETKSTKYMVAYENMIAITRYFSMVLGNYAYHDNDGNPLLHVVDECPMNYRVSYVLRSRSPYTERVNFVLLRLKEAGLFSVWFENITYPLTIVKMRSLRRDDTAIKLTLDHYSLTFLLLFVGLLVSTLVFLGEVYATRRKRAGG